MASACVMDFERCHDDRSPENVAESSLVASAHVDRAESESESGEIGHDALAEFFVEVPANVRPGVTILRIAAEAVGCGGVPLDVRVPAEAFSGDQLRVCKHSRGNWQCVSIRRKKTLADSSQADASSHLPLPSQLATPATSACTASANSAHSKSAVVGEPSRVGSSFFAEMPAGDLQVDDLLRFELEDVGVVEVRAPANARPGDRLIVSREDASRNDAWSCRIATNRTGKDESDSAFNEKDKALTIVVPEGVTPGKTALRVDVGDLVTGRQLLSVVVPEGASQGDTISFTRVESGGWSATLIPKQETVAEENRDLMCVQAMKFQLDVSLEDALLMIERLKEEALVAGIRMSAKLRRGSAPPLNIPGMLAAERIEAGEELTFVPEHLMFSSANFARLMPEVHTAVLNLEEIPSSRRPECAFYTCLAVLLQDAVDRWQKSKCANSVSPLTNGTEACGGDDKTVRQSSEIPEVWRRYADALLTEAFDQHPYCVSIQEPEAVKDILMPSNEGHEVTHLALQILAIFRSVRTSVDESLRGLAFSESTFLHAALSTLTRCFATGNGTSGLAPIADLFNHGADPGAIWEWNEEQQAHIITATRAHERGEEVYISYGALSNVILFRNYGFTTPSVEEQSWTFLVQRRRPQHIYDRFLLPQHSRLVIFMDTFAARPSFIEALNSCADNDQCPEAFLRELCTWALELYRRDPAMIEPIAALERHRHTNPTSAAWWEEMPKDTETRKASDDDSSISSSEKLLGSRWVESAVRVKMSEFLCLTAHFEALECAAGTRSPSECLASANRLTTLLVDCFPYFRSGQRLALEGEVQIENLTSQFFPPEAKTKQPQVTDHPNSTAE
eukprot:TRINITY_DN55800_c0_g1_i1.p1 TRINITY_DN55800_c0_g1~~TRINITY_DN55800_c0_g1_i1.p1  ORF type:complete len:849 (+),score=137.12 TRINITY_DN55800_c0_g1_i1:57-2603(+)